MNDKTYYTKEQIEAAKNTSIESFARSHGLALERAGREIHVKGYGGLYINPEKNVFSIFSQMDANGSPEGGKGALSFAQKVLGMSFLEAMKDIVGDGAEQQKKYNYFSAKKEQNKADLTPKKEFTPPPEYKDGYKALYAYMINTRKIAPETLKSFIKQGILYPTLSEGVTSEGKAYKKINAVFLHKNKDGVPCGADLQGLDSNPKYRFKGCMSHDETDKGFTYIKGDKSKINTVYVFEAPIDLMSFTELHSEIENAEFVALSGLKPTVVQEYIDNPDINVVSCVDSDAAGRNFNERILFDKMLKVLPENENNISHSFKDGDIQVSYLQGKLNNKECNLFLSKDDYIHARKAGEKLCKNSCVWINKSNFSVCHEHSDAGVKDFNDLLKKKKDEQSVDFKERVNDMSKWAKHVQNYERTQQKYEAYRE